MFPIDTAILATALILTGIGIMFVCITGRGPASETERSRNADLGPFSDEACGGALGIFVAGFGCATLWDTPFPETIDVWYTLGAGLAIGTAGIVTTGETESRRLIGWRGTVSLSLITTTVVTGLLLVVRASIRLGP